MAVRTDPAALIEAGARCLKGECTEKVGQEVSRQELMDSISEILDSMQAQERPGRERTVRSFASRHHIEGVALEELIAWICDHREPDTRH
jgi:hypothetical protein